MPYTIGCIVLSNFISSLDLTAPILEDLGDVSLACGDPFSPEVIGSPQVTDNRDVNPEVTYEDVPQAGCIMNRIWTARDAAGNTITRNQVSAVAGPGFYFREAIFLPKFSPNYMTSNIELTLIYFVK